VQTKGVAVMQVTCHAVHTASVVLMTSAQINTQSMTVVEAHDDTSDDEYDNDDDDD